MRITKTSESDKSDNISLNAESIVSQLSGFVTESVEGGIGLHEFERGLFRRLLKIGGQFLEQFLAEHGDGDLGETVVHDEAALHRSAKPAPRRLRTIFGEYQFSAYVYHVRPDKKLSLIHI